MILPFLYQMAGTPFLHRFGLPYANSRGQSRLNGHEPREASRRLICSIFWKLTLKSLKSFTGFWQSWKSFHMSRPAICWLSMGFVLKHYTSKAITPPLPPLPGPAPQGSRSPRQPWGPRESRPRLPGGDKDGVPSGGDERGAARPGGAEAVVGRRKHADWAGRHHVGRRGRACHGRGPGGLGRRC